MSHSVSLYKSSSNMGGGLKKPYPVAASQTIRAGDIVVLTDDNSVIRVRKLIQGDIDAHYTNTSVAGLLGIACHDVATDSSGYPTVATSPPSTVDAGAAPRYKFANVSDSLPRDSASGVAELVVQIFDDESEFKIRAQTTSNAAVTVNSLKLNHTIGIQLYSTTEFASNEAATSTDIIGVVSSVIETDPNYNTSSTQCFYAFRVSRAYQQYNNGGIYY